MIAKQADASVEAIEGAVRKRPPAYPWPTITTGKPCAGAGPAGVTFRTHDPDDRANLAYLATTAGGRRVYLDRDLTDADFVLPVGRLAYDPLLGYVPRPSTRCSGTAATISSSGSSPVPGTMRSWSASSM